jgi:long-chain acyl-CoA synthetase
MIADPATYGRGVPHDEFRRRAAEADVGWVETAGGGFWAVFGHQAVVTASRAPDTYSSAARGAFLVDPSTAEDLQRARQLLVNMDAPEHGRVRRHVTGAFSPRAVQDLSALVRGHAADVVARVTAADRFDAVTDLAAELPLLVLADLLGMPRADRGLLFRWSNALVGFDDPDYGSGDVDRYRTAFAEAFEYALALAAERRRRPRADLVTRLAVGEVDGRRLTDPELCQLWLLLVIAGNETARHLISGALLALVEWPAERDRLVADPGLTATAVDEFLRWVTPIMQFRRTAAADVALGGHRVRAGDKVVLWYVAANRDPRAFHRPDRLDLRRRPNPHLAFGVGPHYCLGSHLAHLEARAALDALRPHLSRLRLLAPPVRLESNFMNGIKAMPMTVSA